MYDAVFSPAFGNRPRTLVGREQILEDFRNGIRSISGSRERARLILGQRGSGKTVLLLEMGDIARKDEYVVASPSIVAAGMCERIIEKLSDEGAPYLPKKKTRITGGSIGAIGFSAGVQLQGAEKEKHSFGWQLSHICSELNKNKKGVLILIDEVQAGSEELKQLIISYQEMVGAGLNVAIVMAGLPGAVAATLNDHVLTFLNRAVKTSLEPLPVRTVDLFYAKAFRELGIKIERDFRRKAAEMTGGSPYMMQLVGHYITSYALDNGSLDPAQFQEAISDAAADYENDICLTILNSLSDKDRAFLLAMLPDSEDSSIAAIGERLKVSSAYVQLYKRRLIEAGVIEQPRRGVVQFAVPYLKGYLIRENL